jgi:hypothetical protein
VNLRERQEQKRRAALDSIQDRVADGSLTIRPMTAAERDRFGVGDPDRPVRRFFVPGARPGTRRAEDEYNRAARAVRERTSAKATPRRIFRIDCVLGDGPCRLQVGEPAVEGADEIVIAIFELGGTDELVVSTADDAVALRVPAAGADVLDFA